ncbi:MAG: ParB N-terminal domain-containing protein [Deltaproteobacteria bacterium]|nr:ParB N-terminal domain-containing protein [Deltaproteobacteria bacterium]
MELEFHQLDLRYRDLRIVTASSRRRLMAELSEAGQQSPVLVTTAGDPARYVLIDGYLRVSVLKRLGHDTVQAVCLDLSEADALLWHHQRQRSHATALEDGWLLRELRDSHGLGGVALSARLSRSPSWVSRRIALVESLPLSVQGMIRKGQLCPYAASKYLVPLARANAAHAETLAQHIASQKLSVRQMHTLYVGWRQSDAEGKERLVQQPMLYLAARAEAKTEARTVHPDETILSDLHAAESIMRRLARRLRERGEVPVGAAMEDAWSAVQQAFDALFTYLKV